jgi:hypothetical protein
MPSRSELLDHAVDVAGNLLAFDSYNGSQTRAVAALRRRVPGFTDEQYKRALAKAIQMFKTARKVVANNMVKPSREYRESGFDSQVLAGIVRAEEPGFRRSTYAWLVQWIDLYYHQM